MQPDEMRHADVAVCETPARPRQARATVGRAHRVRAAPWHLAGDAHGRHLPGGRPRHEGAGQRPDDREGHPSRIAQPAARSVNGCRHRATATAAAVTVCARIPRPHHREHGGIERRAGVEVAGGAAPGLHRDERHLPNEHRRRHPDRPAPDAGPVGQRPEHPRQRPTVDGGGTANLVGFSQAGTPSIVRGSASIAAAKATVSAAISRLTAIKGHVSGRVSRVGVIALLPGGPAAGPGRPLMLSPST